MSIAAFPLGWRMSRISWLQFAATLVYPNFEQNRLVVPGQPWYPQPFRRWIRRRKTTKRFSGQETAGGDIIRKRGAQARGIGVTTNTVRARYVDGAADLGVDLLCLE